MLLFGLFGHRGEEPSRAPRSPPVLGGRDDELRLLEHEEVSTDRVGVQAEVGREPVSGPRLLGCSETLEQAPSARIGERPVLERSSIHGMSISAATRPGISRFPHARSGCSTMPLRRICPMIGMKINDKEETPR